MALTVTKVTPNADTVFGNKRIKVRDITFDNSYTTGGLALTAATLGLKQIHQVLPGGAKNAAGTSAVPVVYDYTNSKLQAFRYDGASAGKAFLEEVANTVDLSTFTVRLTIIGY